MVDIPAAKSAGAILPANATKPTPALKLCVEYRCGPLRLKEHTQAPPKQLPGAAQLSVAVMKASGLADAADALGLVQDEGLNVYITCYIYDGKHVTDVIQTAIVRESFAPVFKFKELLSLDISREFLLGSARAASEIVFEARHRPAGGSTDIDNDDDSDDVVLGTAAVPLLPVLQSDTGLDVSSHAICRCA